MAKLPTLVTRLVALMLLSISIASCQELTSTTNCYTDNGVATRCEPPTQSFSFNRQPQANSTCGSPPTGFCLRQFSIFQGSVSSDCSEICDANSPQNAHPSSLMTDFLLNDESWWQSENSFDLQNTVIIDIALETLVEVSVISFDFASLKPNSFYVLKSDDFGATYTPYHYFATTCIDTFGIDPEQMLDFTNETTILCQSIDLPPVPGQISFLPLLGRPSTNDSVPGYSESLFDFITATNIRVFLSEHFPIVELPSDDLGYFYAINDLNLVGSCQCHGHASSCRINFRNGLYECDCQHNTTGRFCDRCADFYQDAPWRRANGIGDFECKACNCNGHSMECMFDPDVYQESGETSGGVCINCLDNTAGRQCESCAAFYYPVPGLPINDSNICRACDCVVAGVTNNGECAQVDSQSENVGDCFCKTNVVGRTCDQCIQGFFNLTTENPDGCQDCRCNTTGAVSTTCDPVNGLCQCKPNVVGDKCSTCALGHYLPDPNSPEGCQPCNCNSGGSLSSQCNLSSGQCFCRQGIQGRTCSETMEGYFFPSVDFLLLEAEDAIGNFNPIIETAGESVRFTGIGYSRIDNSTDQLDLGSLVLPVGGLYEAVIRYTLQGITIWESVVLTIEPGPEGETESFDCDDTPEISTVTSLTYTSWTMGVGLTNSQTICLRGGRPYTFTLDNFISGVGNLPIFDIDSLVLIPMHAPGLNVFDDIELTTEYQSCVSQYRSLITQSSASPSCVSTIFTVSAAIYNQTLECSCDDTGTQSGTNCDAFGGQCFCLPGVRGRKCDQCNPGFFNLTTNGCSSCNCNENGSRNAFCDVTSGACDCFENIIGRDCSSCADGFRGFDELGCISCTCNTTGSVSTQCDEQTGTCDCMPGVVGESCDRCADLHYGFQESGCSLCSCDPTGSLGADCDIITGTCSCLDNTVSRDCSQCREGSFNLQEDNPLGCQDCFCSGLTSMCTAADGFVRFTISTVFNSTDNEPLNGWRIAQVSDNQTLDSESVLQQTEVDDGISIVAASGVYLEAPLEYLGDRLSSYGRFLLVRLAAFDNGALAEELSPYSVLIENDDVSLVGNFTELDVGLLVIQLHETAGWINRETLSQATPYELQQTLSSLNRLLISVYYSQDIILSQISLDTAVPFSKNPLGEAVTWVEECVCPVGYTGLSCERCAPGFTKTPSNTCAPCECNDFSDDCDPDTGECANCSQSTTGRSCEQCQRGTFGDPTRGITCQACPCPLTQTIGQFSDECSLLASGEAMCTNCPTGHTGLNCESCRTGYFGDPTGNATGQPTMCSDCQCNGNIDQSDPLSCDVTTGVCLRCLGNTAGNMCERCTDGFYGDGIVAKNCTACSCDTYGSESTICDQTSGQCSCLANVIGTNCDRCAPDYYGFGGDTGCLPCSCDPMGSINQQCDNSGQCLCRPGVTAPNCDQCLQGFFNFTDNGCQECTCSPINSESAVCQTDGVCNCLPGSTGPDCRQCNVNLFQSSQGCTECPSCYQEIEEEADYLESRLVQTQSRSQEILLMLSNFNLTPFNTRLIDIQLLVDNIVTQVDGLRLREGDLNAQYMTLLSTINDNLSSQSMQIRLSLDALKSRSTPILVLASTSDQLVNRIISEFLAANMLLDVIRNELLPAIQASAERIGNSFSIGTTVYQTLNDTLSLVTNQTDELRDLISQLAITSQTAQVNTNLFSALITNTSMIVNILAERSRSVRNDVNDVSMVFNSLARSIRLLSDRIEQLQILPPLPSDSTIRDLISMSTMTENDVSTDITNEISSQYGQLNQLNVSLANEKEQLRIQQEQLGVQQYRANSQTERIQDVHSNAYSTLGSANEIIDTAEAILGSLQEFNNESLQVANKANEALQHVTDINTETATAFQEAQSVQQMIAQSVSQVSTTKTLASETKSHIIVTQQESSSFNSSSLLSLEASNAERANSSYSSVNDLSSEASSIEDSLSRQEDEIESVRQRVDSSTVNTSHSSLVDAQTAVNSLLTAFSSLDKSGAANISGIESMLTDLYDDISSANVTELYTYFTIHLQEQKNRRAKVESTISELQEEIDYLKRIHTNLPTECTST